MARIEALNNDTLFEESGRVLKEIPFSKVSIKLKAILALKNNNITKVCDVFSISRNTIKRWVVNFDLYGVEGLIPRKRKSRDPKLSDIQKKEVKLWIEGNPNLTLKELKLRIQQEFFVNITQVGIWKNLKQMKFSYITPRKKHYKQDKAELEEFKKTLPKIIKDHPNKEIFYFDESRFGTHSKIGHAWFKTGTRPEVNIKVGFDNFYLYSAINAKGNNFSYIFSRADTSCFNHFLQEFLKNIIIKK